MPLGSAETRPERPVVLVVDDYPATLKLVARCLAPAGHEVVTTISPREGLHLLDRRQVDAAIVDIRMPEMSGLELLREIKKSHPRVEVIVTTAYPGIDTAIEALREGAYDYLRKPFNLEELAHCTARAVERRRLRREVGPLRTRLGQELPSRELVGGSPAMEKLRRTAAQVAPSDTPVLMDSEFFGHLRGAFTGAVTVLLVEDDSDLRGIAREILEGGGYRVVAAANPDAALEAAGAVAGPIALVVTDVIMPVKSGRQLATELRSVRPDTRVLYISGYTGEAIGQQGVLGPDVSFLQKPFTPDALLHKVREVLDAPPGRAARA